MATFSISSNRLKNLVGGGIDIEYTLDCWWNILRDLTDEEVDQLALRQPGVLCKTEGRLISVKSNLSRLTRELRNAPLWQRVWPRTDTTWEINWEFSKLEMAMQEITTELSIPFQLYPFRVGGPDIYASLIVINANTVQHGEDGVAVTAD